MGSSLYDILGVAPQSERVVIQAAYKAMILKYHPDICKEDPEAEEKAKELNHAFAVLGDPDQRARYDAELRKSQLPWLLNGAADEALEPVRSGPVASAAAEPSRGVAASLRGRLHGVRIAPLPALVLGAALVGAFLYGRYEFGQSAETEVARIAPLARDSAERAAVLARARLEAPPPDVHEREVGDAVREARNMLSNSEMAKAQPFSEACLGRVEASRSWKAADRCFGFDTAISILDSGAANRGGIQPNGYFRRSNVQKRFRIMFVDVFAIAEERAVMRMDKIWNKSAEALEESGEDLSQSDIIPAPFRGEWAANLVECAADSPKKVIITPVHIRIQKGGGRVTKVAEGGADGGYVATIAGKGRKRDPMFALRLQPEGNGLTLASDQGGKRDYVRCR
jgi:curved DNA-binding protein CbpA